MAIPGVTLLLGLPAQAQSFQSLHADSYGQVEFNTPSGNIGCIYTPAGGTPVYETTDGDAELQCDRIEPNYVRAFVGAGAAEDCSMMSARHRAAAMCRS